MAQIRITRTELDTLREFVQDNWQSGLGNPIVDQLACRGLLRRLGSVDDKIGDDFTDTEKALVYARRSKQHKYCLTRRGQHFLDHVSFVAA